MSADPRPAGGTGAAAALLAFTAATVGYGDKRVVERANLAVHAGEIVGLVGPNGAGKSTLLRAVTGAADVITGGVALAGSPVSDMSARDRARVAAVVPQSQAASFSFSARDFVEMGRHPHLATLAQPGERDHAVTERVMRLTDTSRLAATPVDTLSGGDLQRLALAQALAQEPRVLLLDEPVSHLDLNHRLQVLELVRTLADEGLAVLAVFHDLDSAARYSDRIAVVAEGRVAAARRPHEAITPETLRTVFGVRAVVGTDPVTGSVVVTPVLREQALPPASARRGRVLVVAGSGSGAALMRRLALAGFDVCAAALNVGDVDEGVASALGIDHVVLPPYGAMDEEAREGVVRMAAASDAIVVAGVPFGGTNIENLAVAVEAARPLVLIGDIVGRDFAHGRAQELWALALERGAHVAADDDGAISEVETQLVREFRPE